MTHFWLLPFIDWFLEKIMSCMTSFIFFPSTHSCSTQECVFHPAEIVLTEVISNLFFFLLKPMDTSQSFYYVTG